VFPSHTEAGGQKRFYDGGSHQHGAYQYLHYIARNDRITDAWRIGKDLEESDSGLFAVLSRQFAGATEENHETPTSE
jgi:hypothetical protein